MCGFVHFNISEAVDNEGSDLGWWLWHSVTTSDPDTAKAIDRVCQ